MTSSERALLNDSVHDALQEMIFSGALAPGSPLSVPALASRLEAWRAAQTASVSDRPKDEA